MYLLRALSGVSSPAGNRPQVRVQSPTVETFHWPFLDGLARFACRCTDFPPGACFLGNEPLPAFMYFRYVGIRVTNLERSLALYSGFFVLREIARGASPAHGVTPGPRPGVPEQRPSTRGGVRPNRRGIPRKRLSKPGTAHRMYSNSERSRSRWSTTTACSYGFERPRSMPSTGTSCAASRSSSAWEPACADPRTPSRESMWRGAARRAGGKGRRFDPGVGDSAVGGGAFPRMWGGERKKSFPS